MKICIFTATRAEYGLLKPLIDELNKYPERFYPVALISGMHLAPEFGYTFSEINKSDFKYLDTCEVLLSSDTQIGVAKAMGLGLITYSEKLSALNPDLLVLLGDRFELLAVSIAATLLNIPIAHIHGGELTFGAYDDAFRHSITKMACLHFASTEVYRKRIIQMGEAPETVFNVGALGLDNIKQINYLSLSELEKSIGFKLGDKFFVVTYHPETRSNQNSGFIVNSLLEAFSEFNDYKLLFTKANADNEGRSINDAINCYVRNNPNNSVLVDSLGQLRYLSAIKLATLVIGNSSSGIIEAPFLGTPTVNIGNRQAGRIFTKSIIQSDIDKKSIINAIQKGIKIKYDNDIEDLNLYGEGEAAKKIVDILSKIELNKLNRKSFYDIEFKAC